MPDVGPVAGDDLDDVVGLVRAPSALSWVSTSVSVAPSSTTTSTRVAVATAAPAAIDEAQVQRSRSHARRDADHDAVGHEGGVELVEPDCRAPPATGELTRQRIALGEGVGEARRPRRPRAGGRASRRSRAKWPLTIAIAARRAIARRRRCRQTRCLRLRRRIGRSAQRRAPRASAARRSVYFELLDAAVRQARAPRRPRRLPRARLGVARAGPPSRPSKASASARLGGGPHEGDVGHLTRPQPPVAVVGIAVGLELERQLLAARPHDTALRHHMHACPARCGSAGAGSA